MKCIISSFSLAYFFVVAAVLVSGCSSMETNNSVNGYCTKFQCDTNEVVKIEYDESKSDNDPVYSITITAPKYLDGMELSEITFMGSGDDSLIIPIRPIYLGDNKHEGSAILFADKGWLTGSYGIRTTYTLMSDDAKNIEKVRTIFQALNIIRIVNE